MTPLPQRVVPFYDEELIATQDPDGSIFVSFARLCDNLGLARYSQARRVQQHAILREGFVTLTLQTEGGPQAAQCLRLDLLPLWLSSIQARKAKAALQDKLIRYQREAATVLWQAFKPQILVEEAALAGGESQQAIVQLEQIIEQSRAMQRMAEEQIALIRRMDNAARVVKGLQHDVTAIQVRLEVLEDRLHPASFITEEQAATIQSAVNAIAMELTRRDPSKNHFQGIHAELHRRFKVRSYTLIRQEQYAAVLAFLDEWQTSASGA